VPVWAWALGATMLLQTASSFLTQATAVLGPTLTDAAGVSHELIGHLAAVASLGTLWFLMGGVALLAETGPVRLLQLGVVLSALGLLLMASGTWPAMLAASLLLGFGYGPAPPAGSELLMRHAPATRRSLIFSIKQSGAPLGAALAGFVLPPLAAAWGWRVALIAGALGAAATILIVEPARPLIDRHGTGVTAAALRELVSPRMLLMPFRILPAAPALLRLAYVGFCLAIVQGCVFALFVTFLTIELRFDLTAAGAAFAVLQITGALARIAVGWLADRIGSAPLTLAALALGGSVMMIVVATMSAAWPWPAILLVSAATGFLAAGWNGALLAEVARVAPPGRIGEATSSAVFFTFIGYVVGPAGFTLIVQQAGGYPPGFLAIAALPLSAATLLFLGRAHHGR
jgi:MFS family permease